MQRGREGCAETPDLAVPLVESVGIFDALLG